MNDIKEFIRAIILASRVMDYCGGDKWERECTKEDRSKFDVIETAMRKKYAVVFVEIEKELAQ